MSYKIYKNRAGNLRVKYQCPHCNDALENELSEAGQEDTCPSCGKKFVVPGEKKLKQIEAEAIAKKEREEQKKRLNEGLQQLESQQLELERKREAKEAERVAAENRLKAEEQRKRALEKGGPFTYRVVQVQAEKSIRQHLEMVILKEAAEGWEYYSMETIQTYHPAGCIAGLLGMPGTISSNHLPFFAGP